MEATNPVDWLIRHCEQHALQGPHGFPLTPPAFAIDRRDVEQLLDGVRQQLIELLPAGRFNTLDRPESRGHWGLLSFYRQQTILNGEYVPQLAGYVDLLSRLEYPHERVLFEPGDSCCRVDHAIFDDEGGVTIIGEAKVDPGQPEDLIRRIRATYSMTEPTAANRPPGKGREYEAWKLADAIWKLRPNYLWLLAPGVRRAFELSFTPLSLADLPDLPSARDLNLAHNPPSAWRFQVRRT